MNNPVPPPPTKNRKIDNKIPINVFTGFLGSGKSTLIANLIDQIKDTQKLVYIKNETGDVQIDTKLLAGQSIASQELLNGCVCCTLVGPLMETLEDLINQHQPDRIILESSGTAEPTNLALTLNGNPRVYRDSMVSVIDVLNFNQEPKYNDHYQLQAKLTDLLILNKIELVDLPHKNQVIQTLKTINNYSPMVEALEGKIDQNLVFGIPSKIQTENLLTHEHTKQIDSFTIQLKNILDLAKLENVLDALPENIIRVKGLVLAPDPIIINQAYKRRTLTKPNILTNQMESFLYFIGPNILQLQPELNLKLNSLSV